MRGRQKEEREWDCYSTAAAAAACGVILYQLHSNGKDSQSDNKGHKRSRLHVIWACLPCTARRQKHTNTQSTLHIEQLLPQQSPCAPLIGTACLARQQQDPRRETGTQKVTNRQACILQETGCDWHHLIGSNMKTHKATEKCVIPARGSGCRTVVSETDCHSRKPENQYTLVHLLVPGFILSLHAFIITTACTSKP